MPDINEFEYLSNAAFNKGRTGPFTDPDLVRFFADDANEAGDQRPIALNLSELSNLLVNANQLVYTESPAAQVWTINHNFNTFAVTTDIFDSTNSLVFASVNNSTVNQTIITFSTPVAGFAILEAKPDA